MTTSIRTEGVQALAASSPYIIIIIINIFVTSDCNIVIGPCSVLVGQWRPPAEPVVSIRRYSLFLNISLLLAFRTSSGSLFQILMALTKKEFPLQSVLYDGIKNLLLLSILVTSCPLFGKLYFWSSCLPAEISAGELDHYVCSLHEPAIA